MENPNDEDMRGVASYENPGGRPPEDMRQIGVISALERHSSPADLEDQRLAKKGRNGDTDESKDIEVGFAEGSTSADSVHVDSGELGLNGPNHANPPASYAALVAARTHDDDRSGRKERLEPDDVEVLDEDCIIENFGAFPIIRFSDRVHDQLDRIEVPSSSGASSTNLYGPWMIATTRRRRNTNQVEKDRAGTSGYGSGSRFTILQDVDVENIEAGQETIVVQEDNIRRGVVMGDRNATSVSRSVDPQLQIMKNGAYLDSNPPRRQRKELVRKDVNSSVVVVPLQADSRPEVVVPRVVPGRGNHTTVSIVEPKTSARGGPHVRRGINIGHGIRPGKGNFGKGIRFRKCDDHRESGRDILSNRIDPGAERGVMDMIEDDPGDNQAHEFQDDLIVLGSSVDAVLLAGGGVVSS
ncbi:hypothetical protein V6N13_072471 [Hibiscus sabdariffa]|uniref:Uncharacterized protein n=1 Tax=Hibiscus sabdariffa TaxID=183260 RepID=A0ABR2R7F9_9ROSI